MKNLNSKARISEWVITLRTKREDYKIAEKNDKKKIDKLLKEIRRGNQVAHAEALKYELSGYFSVHINNKDRLIYRLDETTVKILSCRGHYDDK